jgi:hypothetical protein
VLCLDGVEVSTIGGHYAVIDLPKTPYPLGGEARDVIEDVRRLGGFGIAAHPDSPKTEMAWADWSLPFDAVEIANLDESWRKHLLRPGIASKRAFLRALLTYPLRGDASMARLMSPSPDVLRRFDEATRARRVVALTGTDAHAKLDLGNADPGDNRFVLPFPGYERVFRATAIRVRPAQPLTGDAAVDGPNLITAIREGRLHSVARGIAWPAEFTFTAENGSGTAGEGGALESGGPVTLRVRSNAPAEFTTEIWRDGVLVASGTGGEVSTVSDASSGVFRAEIREDRQPDRAAWILSNPIHVGSRGSMPAPPEPGRVTRSRSLFDGTVSSSWRTETDPSSLAALNAIQRVNGANLGFRYGLSGGTPVGQFAAAAVDFEGGIGDYSHVTVTVSADHPSRIALRARATLGDRAHSEAWQRSIYLDEEPRTYTIAFSDMTPVGETSAPNPVAPSVYSIVFAVGSPNTPPGASGWVYISRIALERREGTSR